MSQDEFNEKRFDELGELLLQRHMVNHEQYLKQRSVERENSWFQIASTISTYLQIIEQEVENLGRQILERKALVLIITIITLLYFGINFYKIDRHIIFFPNEVTVPNGKFYWESEFVRRKLEPFLGEQITIISPFIAINGTNFTDTISMNWTPITYTQSGGSYELTYIYTGYSTKGNDTVLGEAGNDVIYYLGSGNDQIGKISIEAVPRIYTWELQEQTNTPYKKDMIRFWIAPQPFGREITLTAVYTGTNGQIYATHNEDSVWFRTRSWRNYYLTAHYEKFSLTWQPTRQNDSSFWFATPSGRHYYPLTGVARSQASKLVIHLYLNDPLQLTAIWRPYWITSLGFINWFWIGTIWIKLSPLVIFSAGVFAITTRKWFTRKTIPKS